MPNTTLGVVYHNFSVLSITKKPPGHGLAAFCLQTFENSGRGEGLESCLRRCFCVLCRRINGCRLVYRRIKRVVSRRRRYIATHEEISSEDDEGKDSKD